MRINRQKKVNRHVSFYINNFGFRNPFQILIDATFCQEALKSKVNIQDQLPKYLGNIKLLTTPCVIMETEKLGPAVYGAMLIVKQFPIIKCGHESNPLSAFVCLKKVIGTENSNRYFLATQDSDLQQWGRRVPGLPLLILINKALTLPKPSSASYQVATLNASSTLSVTEREKLKKLKEETLGPVTIKPPTSFYKKKRKGGPNPLSCKKKKKKLNKENRADKNN